MHGPVTRVAPRPRPLHALAAAAAVLLMTLVIMSATAPRSSADAADASRGPSLAAQVERGEAVYAFHCTTCHGATGRGFEEARSVFPADHYHCIRCHAPSNPPVMTQRQIDQTQSVFSLGDPPPVNDPHSLARFGTAAGLHGYVRATMPRWNPGWLDDDDDYLDVTVFVLHLAGMLPEHDEALSVADLAHLALRPVRSD